MSIEHFDVLIIGAGLSGVGAAYHLQKNCPDKSFAILEGRSSIGGTWDLFRYPGVRSDSDMYTLGYSFKPWEQPKAIADGPSILKYVQDTARDHGIVQKIRFGHSVKAASWSSGDGKWTVQAERGELKETVQITCNFLFMCSGYYSYERGFTPEFPGINDFSGTVVHPQKWTPDVAYAGKQVVVIGSGATAVTLVPELAKQAAHVTMLQRSPTYVVARPSEDAMANWMRRYLPSKLAHAITRWKNVLLGMYVFALCKTNPARVKRLLLDGVRMALGPGYDVNKHFTPRYNPWEQRLCLVPDGDFFKAVRTGRASVVTDTIERFTETGIALTSGAHLDADIVVTATGLALELAGGLQVSVDGVPVDWPNTLNYKGLMYSGVPNFAAVFGYTNASWTLKADLISEYVCRLLNHMAEHGLRQCTPRNGDPGMATEPWVDFSSGYLQREMHRFPKQGSRGPWKLNQNYLRDLFALRYGRLDDGAMTFA